MSSFLSPAGGDFFKILDRWGKNDTKEIENTFDAKRSIDNQECAPDEESNGENETGLHSSSSTIPPSSTSTCPQEADRKAPIAYDVTDTNNSISVMYESFAPLLLHPTRNSASSSSSSSSSASPLMYRRIHTGAAYYLNDKKMTSQTSHPSLTRMYEINVRPDVGEDSILTVCEQILLTIGGAVKRTDEGRSLEVDRSSSSTGLTSQASHNSWTSIRVHIGCNQSKHRVIVVVVSVELTGMNAILPTLGVGNTTEHESVISGGGNVIYALDDGLGDEGGGAIGGVSNSVHGGGGGSNGGVAAEMLYVVQQLAEALHSECLSISSLHPYNEAMFLSSPVPLPSVVDPCFVRDLQASCGQEMMLSLTLTAETLDNHTKSIEKQCARMMTTLKPTYTRASIATPFPPPAKPLSDFPLKLKRKTSITDASLEMARLLILRARKYVREEGKEGDKDVGHVSGGGGEAVSIASASSFAQHDEGKERERDGLDANANQTYDLLGISASDGDSSVTVYLSYLARIRLLNAIISNICEQMRDWCDEESTSRLKRKTQCVRHRVFTIEGFRRQLLLTLHERPTFGAGVVGGGAADVAMMQSLQEKCRVIDFSKQPILLDCPSTQYHDRRGTLYLTAEFIIFYSAGSLFTSEELQLVPLKALIATATVIGGVVTVLSPSILTLEREKENRKKNGVIQSAGGSGAGGVSSRSFGHLDRVNMNHILLSSGVHDCVCVVDEGGKVDSFRLSGATVDFCSRVADVINVIIQARLYEKVQGNDFNVGAGTTTSAAAAAGGGGAGAAAGGRKNEAINAKGSININVNATQVPVNTPSALIVSREPNPSTDAPLLAMPSSSMMETPASTSTAATTSTTTPSSSVTVTTEATATAATAAAAEKKAKLGKNIQAFLEKSQAKK